MKVAIIQMSSYSNVAENLKTVCQFTEQAVQQNAKFIVLPENFAGLGGSVIEVAKKEKQIVEVIKKLAIQNKIWIAAGTIPVLAKDGQSKCWASSMVFNPLGEVSGNYNKIHLFDSKVSDNKQEYRESDFYCPGDRPVVVETPLGKIGLTVCYDLRFPELFRKLVERGAELLSVPSAFTEITGRVHWEVLLRARAIENQCYVLAPNQCGEHDDGRRTWGHSMVVNPWGDIVAKADDTPSVITADIDLEYLKDIRDRMPCLKHRYF